MIFYRINSVPAKIVGTQADARREAREAKASWEQVDVPTDKSGLMAYVNELLSAATEERQSSFEKGFDAGAQRTINAAPEPINMASVAAKQIRQSQESFTASEIEDFILNRATVAQTENIFACLGTRFAETIHSRRAA